MNYKKSITGFLIAVITFATLSPLTASAQAEALLPILPSVPIFAVPTDTLPPIPISDSALRNKEVGITVFGYTIPGLSFDKLAIYIAKRFIERMVDTTVKWINSGFDGNPAYVSNPKQYFADIADGVAGEYILGSDLGLLCSPFQANIRLSLTQQYHEAEPFQCTLSQIFDNVEDSYKNFSKGGWDGWFSMTQTASNNPYGAYLEAKVELDSRILEALNLKQEQLNWGSGFLNFESCDLWGGDDDSGGPDGDTTTKDECLRSTVKTPGKVIETQLESHLGTGLRQLELADEFDELIGALLAQLLNKTVFSIKGLFKAEPVTGSGPDSLPPPVNPPTPPSCPVPTGPASLCSGVDGGNVVNILNGYPVGNQGLRDALPEIQAAYGSHVVILEHPVRLDKLDFGGGLVADVVYCSGGSMATTNCEPAWTWGVDCPCGGTAGNSTTPPVP